jgi:hypothetical protein
VRVRVLFGPDCGQVVDYVYHAARTLLDQGRAIPESAPYPIPVSPSPSAEGSATPPPAPASPPAPSSTAPVAAPARKPRR